MIEHKVEASPNCTKAGQGKVKRHEIEISLVLEANATICQETMMISLKVKKKLE